MTFDDFKALEPNAQRTWLEEQTSAQREVNDICDELGTTRAQLQGLGYTYALGNWHYMSFEDRASTVGQN